MSQDGPGNGGERAPVPSAPTEGLPEGLLAPGQVLGDRYQIRSQLGRGGMGEVWRAFDLKLRVEVALKAMLPDLFKDERRRDLLRREVRAAREVVSPNVCRIFDLIEVDGSELVSMEYVDGATLLGVLQERGPLELKEAQDIASQFLAGLEAIHKAGLIHRDIKPENIMLTRAGRVVVMDFGLARQETEGGGTVSGTPAYMAPEQAAGQTLDARADVYAAGVVLAEMVCPEGIKNIQSRHGVWEGVRSEPAKLPDTPWTPVIQKAVKKDRENRFNSAHTLARALEDVTLRVEGADDLHPYPGLASFTEDDAEYFFGREAEVEQMWRKLQGPPRLFAIMGPSGAGKSSFIAAGLVTHAPPDWGIIRSTPGNAATSSLAGVVARETAGDPDAVELLPRFGDADVAVQVLDHWAEKKTHALVVVDQFEELFTQNSIEEQRRFADLLRRFVLESNIHVLLSMRDDFAAACNAHEPLRPIFHELTVLDPPTGGNLRRAVVQPATKCGYRFEDDELAEEMLAEVEGERGALPLLAFAAARLWEKRDRDNGVLTRQAYQDIGGVGGALARHAEATIDRIGTDRIAIVRELFRNLVTAEGTRAVREWTELLSIFEAPQFESAEEVLRELIDARLLTSYEIHEDEGEPTRRIEIIHESLLANWPRLVRWQTQDADAVQLRDQLREAAQTWEKHDRSDDMLWAGSAYREYAVWRESYPGGLSAIEQAFGDAMSSLATRRRRRRRFAIATSFAALIVVLMLFGTLWQRSVRETLRAEAQKLITLGHLQLLHPTESDPTLSLAYAIASLELADSDEARHLSLEALWKRPPRLEIPGSGGGAGLDFSADGRQLAAGIKGERIAILGSSGAAPTKLRTEHSDANSWVGWVRFSADSSRVFSVMYCPDHGAQMWSVPEGRLLRSFDIGGLGWRGRLCDDDSRLITLAVSEDRSRLNLTGWPLPEGAPMKLGELPLDGWPDIDPSGRLLAYPSGSDLHLLPLARLRDRSIVPVARHENPIRRVAFDQKGTRIAAADDSGEVRVWSISESPAQLLRTLQSCTGNTGLEFNDGGSLLAAGCVDYQELWNLEGPPEAAPMKLAFDGSAIAASFDPQGRWIAVTHWDAIGFWPLDRRYPSVLPGHTSERAYVVFAPDSSWLGSASGDGTVRLWPLSSSGGQRGRVLLSVKGRGSEFFSLAVTPDGQSLVAGTRGGDIWHVPISGESPKLVGRSNDIIQAIAVSPDGRTIATGGGSTIENDRIIRLWDLETGLQRHLDPGDNGDISDLEFLRDGRLLAASGGTLRRWNLKVSGNEVLVEKGVKYFDLSTDETGVLFRSGGTWGYGPLKYVSLVDGGRHDLPSFEMPSSLMLDPTGKIAVTGGGRDGIVRVGPTHGGEPHLLFGHQTSPWSVAVSSDGRWIASAGTEDLAIRLWPMPDLSKPPLHTLPHEELIAKLKTLTNLRIVRDLESESGWTLTHDPFPGWETVPEW